MNVKPGDLAIIIGADSSPENIGKIVTVVRPWKEGDKYPDGVNARTLNGATCWWIRSCGAPLLKRRVQTGIVRPFDEAHIQDRHLRPLRPTEEPVTTQREEEMQK